MCEKDLLLQTAIDVQYESRGLLRSPFFFFAHTLMQRQKVASGLALKK